MDSLIVGQCEAAYSHGNDCATIVVMVRTTKKKYVVKAHGEGIANRMVNKVAEYIKLAVEKQPGM